MFRHRFASDSASEESSRTFVYDALEGKRDGCQRGGPTCWRPVLPRPTPPCRTAVRRPAPNRSWFVWVFDLSNLKPRHTTGGTVRSARWGGWAGSGRTKCRQSSSPRRQASKTSRLNDPPEARTSEILCKPTCRVQNPDIPRAGRSKSGRSGAWPGRKRRRRYGSPRRHLSLVHTRYRRQLS